MLKERSGEGHGEEVLKNEVWEGVEGGSVERC